MTRDELIGELRKFPQGIEVKVTWEGTVHSIEPDNLYMSKDGILLIDADYHSDLYKKMFQSGELAAMDDN